MEQVEEPAPPLPRKRSLTHWHHASDTVLHKRSRITGLSSDVEGSCTSKDSTLESVSELRIEREAEREGRCSFQFKVRDGLGYPKLS